MIRTLSAPRNIQLVLTTLIMTVRNQDQRWRIGSMTTRARCRLAARDVHTSCGLRNCGIARCRGDLYRLGPSA
jgi:hypothetical protein